MGKYTYDLDTILYSLIIWPDSCKLGKKLQKGFLVGGGGLWESKPCYKTCVPQVKIEFYAVLVLCLLFVSTEFHNVELCCAVSYYAAIVIVIGLCVACVGSALHRNRYGAWKKGVARNDSETIIDYFFEFWATF